MRAQVFHGPGDLRFEDLPIPEPEAGGIVVRIEAALTCGTDVKVLRRGHRIYEVPISYAGRELSEGKKITWQDGVTALWTLVKYRFVD